ncbi:MAG: DUF599 family protein [Xanthobacteraceae bacterium]
MLSFSTLDVAALAWFLAAWAGYSAVLDRTAYGRSGLNMLMHRYREDWMRQMIRRDMRMLDGQVSASLQNGTAFFASTSLLAVGGALTLFHSSGEILSLVGALPFGAVPTRLQWETKTVGLAIIMVYAFFKFAWSYRLFNYMAIMLGAAPPAAEKDTAAAQDLVHKAARLCEDAGRQFNRGQRAFFFALAYLGWFVGPLPFIFTTAGVLVVMWRRQFDSTARRAIVEERPTA